MSKYADIRAFSFTNKRNRASHITNTRNIGSMRDVSVKTWIWSVEWGIIHGKYECLISLEIKSFELWLLCTEYWHSVHIELEPRVFQPQHDTQIDWCLAHQLTTHQPLSNISSHSHFVVTISISKQRGSEGKSVSVALARFSTYLGFTPR